MKIYWRNKGGFYLRIRLALATLFFCCLLFYDCGYDRQGIQNRKGCLFFIMLYSSIASLHAVAFNLKNDRELLKKDLTEGNYGISSYFFGKTFAGTFPSLLLVLTVCNIIHGISNLNGVNFEHYLWFNLLIALGVMSSEALGLFLSSLLGSQGSTRAIIPFLIFSLCLFAGLLISIDSIPTALVVLNYSSFFKYYYEGLIVNEFTNLNRCKNNICKVPKDEMSFTHKPKYSFMIMCAIVVSARFLGYMAFYLKHRKYYYDAMIEKNRRKRNKSRRKAEKK